MGLCLRFDGKVSILLLTLALCFTPMLFTRFRQKEYFDEPVANESPVGTKNRLAQLAKESVGVDEKKFLELVSTSQGNSGSAVTNDLKLQVKLGR